jgi:hypothetical protein
MRRSYHPWRTARRAARRIRNGAVTFAMSAAANRVYRRHQLALARTGLSRIAARGLWPGTPSPALPALAALPTE